VTVKTKELIASDLETKSHDVQTKRSEFAKHRRQGQAVQQLDSNCDTCTFGKGARIVNDTGETVSLDPFLESLGSLQRVRIVTAAVAHDDPTTCQTYILFFPQSLCMPSLRRHLLCPNQMRTNGVTINDTALIHLPRNKRNKHSHSIIAEAEETFEEVHMPLELDEQTTSYFITRKPTQREIDNIDHSCIHVHMTPTSPWEPGDQTIGDNEATLRAYITNDAESCSRGRKLHAMATKDDKFSILNPTLAYIRRQNASAEVDIDSFAEELERVSISAVQTKARKGTVSPETLAK